MPGGHDPALERGLVRGGFPLWRLVALGGLIALAVLIYLEGWHRELSPEALLRQRADIVAFVTGHWFLALAAFIVLDSVLIALSLPVSLFMSTTAGFLFGILAGGLAGVTAGTFGSSLLFLIARSAMGEHLIRRAGPLAARVAAGFRADAFSYVLFLRLVPVPFWLVNLAAALARVPLPAFVAATAVGIVPITFTFAFFGAGLDSVIEAQEAPYKACLAAARGGCRVDLDFSQVLTPGFVGGLIALGCLALVPVLARHLWGKTVTSARRPLN
jgi:uncharacterized membrane protein YdjX (TVP38/TMEM64 family)